MDLPKMQGVVPDRVQTLHAAAAAAMGVFIVIVEPRNDKDVEFRMKHRLLLSESITNSSKRDSTRFLKIGRMAMYDETTLLATMMRER